MKYIDADKLIERLEEMKRAEYENCGGVNSKTGVLQEVQELISTLQQEQPELPGVELEEEITRWLGEGDITDTRFEEYGDSDIEQTARHFAEWGAVHLNARK